MVSTAASSVDRQQDARARLASTFRRLWTAQTVALFGAEITALALPLTAALTLGASPFQMGLLVAAGEAPFLLCSLPLGVYVDRVRRRPLLIAADAGRALLLTLIPAAALLGMLRIELLYVVAFLAGVLSVLFEVAHYAYVPSLIPREVLTAANGKLQTSYSAAETIGPGLAGLLIQWLSAPLAVIGTAASFLASAVLLGTLPHSEPEPVTAGSRSGFRSEAAAGLRALLGHPLLRPIVVASAATGLFHYAVRAIYVLFATRELGLDALQLGAVLAAGGIAAIPGGLLAERAAARFGFGPAVWGGWFIEGAAMLLIPLATEATAIAILVAAQALGGLAHTIANVNQWSLRQVVTPDHLQGRVTASHRFLVYGVFPLGALLGGTLATTLGMRPALLIAGIGATLCPLWLLATPLRSLRTAPIGGASHEDSEGERRAGQMDTTPTTKESVLARIDAGMARWETLLADVGDERMAQPGVTGDWTFKDVAAHLNAWREWSLARLAAAGAGGEPSPPWPAGMDEESDEGTDAINAWFDERARGRPAAGVIAESREQIQQMRAIVDALSPDDLCQPGRFTWLGDYPLSAVIDGSFEHLEEHEQGVREWLAELELTPSNEIPHP